MIVLIEWEDHCGGTSGWHTVEDFKDACKEEYLVQTVGHVVSENKDRIVVVQNYATTNDMVNHHMTILKKTVRSIKTLRK